MRENNWEYALDCSAGNGNYYAADRGEAYLSYWEKGLGISWDGSDVPEWRKQLDLVARLQDRPHPRAGAAAHQAEMTAVVARQQFGDGAGFAMPPDAQHDAVIDPFHALPV